MLVIVVLVVLAATAVGALSLVLVTSARSQRAADDRTLHPLPAGAEAALHSVTEVQGHPRNVLVLKDPTSQMRLTQADRDTAGRAAAGHAAAVAAS